MKSMMISVVAFALLAPVGDGLLISKDEGKTWTPSKTDGLPAFTKIAGEKTLFAISRRALYRSGDSGQTWNQVKLEGKPYFRDLDIADDGTVYVTESNGVRYSKDEGKSWTLIDFPPKKMGSISISTAPNHLAVLKKDLYAVTDNGHKIRRSTDSGKTWKIVHEPKGYIGAMLSTGKHILALGDNVGLLTGRGEKWFGSVVGLEGTNVAGCDLARRENTLACAVVTEFGRHPVLGLFLSRDGGGSWAPIKGLPNAAYPGGGEAAWRLAFNDKGDTLSPASSAGLFSVAVETGRVRELKSDPMSTVIVHKGSILVSPR